jgi:signal recognition particle subunit SRP54
MFETLSDRLNSTFSLLKGRKELTEENVAEGLGEVRQAMLEADVHFGIARDFTERVRVRLLGDERLKGVEASEQFVHAFHQELVELMGPEDAQLEFAKSGPTVILMAGLQGAGKTTTCAKLARWLRDKRARRPLLVAADTKRPAAVEQLKVLGRQLDIPVFHEEGLTPPRVCVAGVKHAAKQGYDVVLLDTAGRLHVDDELMEEVALIAKATRPQNQVLVVDAMTGQDAVNSAKAFHERLALSGCILTKLDGDARGGAAVSLKAVTGVPILFTGTGEKIEDLDSFHPERMAGRILGMGDVVGLVDKAQGAIDEEEAQASMEKMLLGSFTLEDMLAQFRMIKKMGPMKQVLGMMPGMPKEVRNMDIDDRHMNRLEALFTSMTPRERLRPDVLDMSRRRRIARGAGQDVGAVNELLKRFKDMKKTMKQLNKMGLGSMFGASAKKETLRGMSATGELASGGGGMMEGLGNLGAGLGAGVKGLGSRLMGGGSGGLDGLGAGGDMASMMGGARPMGSSATRKSGSKRKRKDKKKRRKGKR